MTSPSFFLRAPECTEVSVYFSLHSTVSNPECIWRRSRWSRLDHPCLRSRGTKSSISSRLPQQLLPGLRRRPRHNAIAVGIRHWAALGFSFWPAFFVSWKQMRLSPRLLPWCSAACVPPSAPFQRNSGTVLSCRGPYLPLSSFERLLSFTSSPWYLVENISSLYYWSISFALLPVTSMAISFSSTHQVSMRALILSQLQSSDISLFSCMGPSHL